MKEIQVSKKERNSCAFDKRNSFF